SAPSPGKRWRSPWCRGAPRPCARRDPRWWAGERVRSARKPRACPRARRARAPARRLRLRARARSSRRLRRLRHGSLLGRCRSLLGGCRSLLGWRRGLLGWRRGLLGWRSGWRGLIAAAFLLGARVGGAIIHARERKARLYLVGGESILLLFELMSGEPRETRTLFL